MRDSNGRFVKGCTPHNKGNGKGRIGPYGYRYIYVNGKERFEHHINWMNDNGLCFIPKGWIVHHRNMNRLDNRPENLLLVPDELHKKWHWEYEKENGINRFGGNKMNENNNLMEVSK